MASFEHAIPAVLRHEGGYTVDHAGPTNWGITLPTLRRAGDFDGDGWDDGDVDRDGDIDGDDIRKLPRHVAEAIYRNQWWDRYRYALLQHQDVATKIFDLAVNMGPSQAHRILQRACNDLGLHLAVDGILGPLTRAAANSLSPDRLLPRIRYQALRFYESLQARNPRFSKYLDGWTTRALW